MTIYPASTGFVQIGAYRLNVTTRAASFGCLDHLDKITFDTIKLWMFCAGKIRAGVSVLDLPADMPPTVEHGYGVEGTATEPHCTVWGDVESGQSLTVHSNSDAQWILDAFNARAVGIAEALKKYPVPQQSAPQTTPESPQEARSAVLPPSTVPTHTDAIIDAVGFPAARGMQYANEQLVRFHITRITLSIADGKPVYGLYMERGQFPSFKIYTDNEIAMGAVGDMLNGLELGMAKPEVAGNWSVIVKTANREKGGSPIQYYNPVRFE